MGNDWWELQIISHPDQEESIFWRLDGFGCRGMAREVQGEAHVIRAYIPQSQVSALDLAALSLWLRQDAQLFPCTLPQTHWQTVAEEDWASSWKQHWQPNKIGDRFLVVPAWLTPHPDEGRQVLLIDPGVAFGTGVHPTTQLCLESLEMRFALPNAEAKIVDIGCGSGILSIGACLLGAQRVYAVDTDPLAVQATRNNCYLNQLSPQQVLVKRGSVEKLSSLVKDGVDGILCNILAETIIELMPTITTLANKNTWATLSGILNTQASSIAKVVEQNGWRVAAIWQREDWCCFNIRRS